MENNTATYTNQGSQQQSSARGKSKQRLYLAFLAIIILIGLVIIIVFVKSLNKQSPQNLPSPYAKTVLQLESVDKSNNLSLSVVNVKVTTGTNKITAAQLEITYNPKALLKVDVQPGSFFKDAVVLLKKINDKDGTITYAIAAPLGQNPVSGIGDLAIITYSKNPSFVGKSNISILPTSLITDETISKSVLKSSASLEIQP